MSERILAAAAMVAGAELVRASHERYDGSGYPDRRSGEDIPLEARIVAVCDAFNAMKDDCPYSRGIDPGEAIADLRRRSGSQCDPNVEVFCARLSTLHLELPRFDPDRVRQPERA